MKNRFLLQVGILITILLSQINTAKAQWVTIPDPNFVLFLQEDFPNCMNGDQLDTICAANYSFMNCQFMDIQQLEGIQYFSNLELLFCGGNPLISLPELPNSIQDLRFNYMLLNSLPALPNSLTTLYCDNNQLTSLPELPNSLIYLYCYNNQLTSLPELPNSLNFLHCYNNQLTSLPELPNSLNLLHLHCYNNQLTSLPELPNSLTRLYCDNNQLTSLPESLGSLYRLKCNSNQLTLLPELPGVLVELQCSNNQLTSLPEFPNSIESIYCSNNQLTLLPDLPQSIHHLDCAYNNITCFPILPEMGYLDSYLYLDGNPFTCLPNYNSIIFNFNPNLLAYPICEEGDFINNPNNCKGAKGITGSIYKDVNADCINDTPDLPCQNIPVQLFDESNNLISTYYSSLDSNYYFYQFSGTYKVAIDTLNKPYTVSCPEIGIDSIVVLDENNTFVNSVSFAIECKPGLDLKVRSFTQSGLVLPGEQHRVNVIAGDILRFYNLNCATDIGGTVQINVNGPVVYDGIVTEALVPDAIVGNSFTYNIADFGTLTSNSFGLLFLTDTTAQEGESVCFTASITPDEIDNDTTNNTLTYCYPVVSSFDPNEKEVYPTSVLPGYDGYFTYTIHFQNTGTAPAINIKVQDTLSTHLDLSTFEITAYSHPNNTTLTGNLISFKFPNIWLPDSTSDLEGSKGFIQYRIKPLPSLPVGTQITNTAYIYFDYNDPIQTNTTESNFEIINGIKAYSKGKVSIYPNPNNGMFHVNLLEKNQNEKILELTNLLGEKVWSQKTRTNSTTIDINYLPKGIYILNITDINSHYTERVIKN